MKFFRIDLLTLLISLFILGSCKNQDTVGLGIQSSRQLNGTLVVDTAINTNTVLEDSVITSGSLAKNPLAYFNDPIFGLTVSDLATDLNLPGQAGYSLPTGTVYIDSVRLVLGYADGFYGDSLTSQYKVNVYQLNEKFNSGVSYYNTRSWNYNSSNLLGTWTFTARTHDSVYVKTLVSGAPDTVLKRYPQVRIPISTDFINKNFFNAGSLALNSNTIFNNNIKGLYITIDKAKTTGAGGVFMIRPNDTLAVYYRSVNGATIDTAQAYLPITNMAASIRHTYSTAIQTELNNTTSSRGTVYLQGLAGLRAKISFPSVLSTLRTNLANKDSDIVLNRAELVISASPSTDIPYSPLPKITMYRLDVANQRILIQDANDATADPRAGGISIFGGYYSKTTKTYHFIITAFLQDMLSGKTKDYGTYIAPIDTANISTVDIAATAQVAARSVLAGGTGSSASSPYKMKLNIIYTKIHK